ncbi:TrmH family RNA methyltransferase [Actinomyces vulturis]|uniref:TrmH family RNA methyltransferase n=1 Tax=Actinomyces vulturis TaxID=1857645 RepID=UPI00159EEDDD|nr:TrmH family RNA methyltransferase [Actinomyces vulturis]
MKTSEGLEVSHAGECTLPSAPIEDSSDAPYTQDEEVGVGPWPSHWSQWPTDPHYDRDLLYKGDRRNVVDRFRYWSVEAIKEELASRAHGMHVAIENVSHDLNIGSIVRTANAFNVGGVHVVGRRRWNRRGAMVTDRYLSVYHHPTPADFAQWAQDNSLELIAIDNGEGSTLLEQADLPERCVLVMGSESDGISSELLSHCPRLLRIGQYGSTRSINVSAAAAIAMHTWIVQHGGTAPD